MVSSNPLPPVWQVVGYQNSGKTTLVAAMIRMLQQDADMRIFTCKHDAHSPDFDQQGKDSWKHREAGALGVWLASRTQSAFFVGYPQASADRPLPSVKEIMMCIHNLYGVDLFLLEGFKQEPFNKIALIRDDADMALVETLKSVRLLVFSREEDAAQYQSLNKRLIPHFLISEQEAIMSWFKERWEHPQVQ